MKILYRNRIWLEGEYLGLRKSGNQIAKECCVGGVAIRDWLRKFNIPIRDRSQSHKGIPSWSVGLTKETDERLRKTSEALKGRSTWIKGLTKGTDERLRNRIEPLKGHTPWNKWLTKETDERLRKKSEEYKGRCAGENHPNWQDGKSFEPYSTEFTDQLKELIRQRDNYQCQKCGCLERENMRKLSVHHIDYDKQNCLPSNLFSLCCGCNSIVNQNREFWTRCFKKKMNLLYGANYGLQPEIKKLIRRT